MNENFVKRIATDLQEIETAGLMKKERIISSEQGAEIIVGGKNVLNFCANITWVYRRIPKCWQRQKNILPSGVMV